MAYPVSLMAESDNNWAHRNYVYLFVKETDWFVSLQDIFWRFFNFPPNSHKRKGDNRSCAWYIVYGVDKLGNNSNLYMKKSTRPKLTLYLPRVENVVAQVLWWLAIIFISNVFLLPVFQLPYIQYSSKSSKISELREEGLIVAWWCSASARPTFQSNVAVYNHARWSRIITGFFWIVYYDNEQ